MAIVVASDLEAARTSQVKAWLEDAGLKCRTIDPAVSTVTGAGIALVVTTRLTGSDLPLSAFIEQARTAGHQVVLVCVGEDCKHSDCPDSVYRLATFGQPDFVPVIAELRRVVDDGLADIDSDSVVADPNDSKTSGRPDKAQTASATKTSQTTAFLSYRRSDSRTMNMIREELSDRGYKVWWDKDKKSIPASSFWPSSVEVGIARCDAVIVLISPSVLEKPKQMQNELYLAQAKDKKIIPVFVRPVDTLPAGWEFILAGRQRVDLFRDFSDGIETICDALGPTDTIQAEAGLRAKVSRAFRRAKKFANDPDVRANAKQTFLTLAALAVAAAAASSATKNNSSRQDRAAYIERMEKLLVKNLEEAKFARQFDPDFRGRFQHLLGQVEATAPPLKLAERHRELVDAMKRFGMQYDEVVRKGVAGDQAGFDLAIQRINDDWVQVLRSNVDWLRTAAAAGLLRDDGDS